MKKYPVYYILLYFSTYCLSPELSVELLEGKLHGTNTKSSSGLELNDVLVDLGDSEKLTTNCKISVHSGSDDLLKIIQYNNW